MQKRFLTNENARAASLARRRLTSIAAMFVTLGFSFSSHASADVWSTLVRRTAKVADDVPIRQADEWVDSMKRSRGLQDVMNSRFTRAARGADELELAAKQAARRGAVRSALNAAAEGVDPTLLRSLDDLDDVARETALVLAEGGQHTAHVIPDIAARSALVRRGGLETLAGVGMYGEDAARAALRLDAAVQSGKIASRSGRAATVADFGRLLNQHGDAGWTFWTRYVQPHWGKWLTGGAITAYLLAPEEFMDATGELTEQGAKKLTELVGAASAAVIRGVGAGSGNAASEVGNAVWDTYFGGWQGILALIGTLALLTIVLPRPRRFVWGRIYQMAVASPASANKKETATD